MSEGIEPSGLTPGPMPKSCSAAIAVDAEHRRVCGAVLRFRNIAVNVLLIEPAIVADAREGERGRGLRRAVERDHVRLVHGRLWRRERVAPGLVEELDGCGGGHADEVVGSRVVEMELGVVALGAKIGIHAPDHRFREIAEAVVVNALQRHEGGPASVVGAVCQRALVAAEGAAAHVELGALEVEPVLHLDRDRAAQGIQAEDRVFALWIVIPLTAN